MKTLRQLFNIEVFIFVSLLSILLLFVCGLAYIFGWGVLEQKILIGIGGVFISSGATLAFILHAKELLEKVYEGSKEARQCPINQQQKRD